MKRKKEQILPFGRVRKQDVLNPGPGPKFLKSNYFHPQPKMTEGMWNQPEFTQQKQKYLKKVWFANST